jgi:FtsH-binding integral membrane protein
LLESAESDPRLAYNYAMTEDGGADVDQGRKVQERTVRVMRFSLFLGLLAVAGVFLGFLLGGLLKDKPTLIIACIIFPLAFLLVLALNLKYALGVSKDDQADFDRLYRENDLPAAAPAPAAEP